MPKSFLDRCLAVAHHSLVGRNPACRTDVARWIDGGFRSGFVSLSSLDLESLVLIVLTCEANARVRGEAQRILTTGGHSPGELAGQLDSIQRQDFGYQFGCAALDVDDRGRHAIHYEALWRRVGEPWVEFLERAFLIDRWQPVVPLKNTGGSVPADGFVRVVFDEAYPDWRKPSLPLQVQMFLRIVQDLNLNALPAGWTSNPPWFSSITVEEQRFLQRLVTARLWDKTVILATLYAGMGVEEISRAFGKGLNRNSSPDFVARVVLRAWEGVFGPGPL